jgi:hypothetical protein
MNDLGLVARILTKTKWFLRSCLKDDGFEKHAVISDKTEEHPRFGQVTFYHVNAGGVHLENVAWEFKDNKSEEDMKGWIGFSKFIPTAGVGCDLTLRRNHRCLSLRDC